MTDYMEDLSFSVEFLIFLNFQISDEDADRVRFNIYMNMTQLDNSFDLSQENSNNLVYFGRKVTRKEFTKRLNENTTKENLQRLARKYFSAKKYSFSSWGDISETKNSSNYDIVSLKKDPHSGMSYINLV